LTTHPAGAGPSLTDLQRRLSDAETSAERVRFLAEASRILASSLDYHGTLTSVARLAVPHVADWCVVDILGDDGTLQRLAVAHVDPELVALVRDLHERYPPNPLSRHGVVNVVRTGKPEIVDQVLDEWLVRAARNAEHLGALRRLQLKSYMCVPLVARGRTVGAITLVTVTDRRYARDDLLLAEDLAWRMATAIDNARLYEEAQHASRTKDEFLAIVSHELRTPLTATLGWLHLLRTNKLDVEATEEALESLERSTRAQVQLIGDLLDISRIVSGKFNMEFAPVDPAALVESVIGIIRPTTVTKDITVEHHVERGLGRVLGDSDRLQQVLWNLASNAIKFTPKGGSVRIELRRADGDAEIVISDTGIGIRPDFLPFVFDRFRQGDSSTTRAHSGLGLGLAIVRYLVEAHGGTVTAASEGTGRGATFTVRLPLAAAAEPVQPSPQPVISHTLLSGARILVVDDDSDMRELVKRALESHNAQVVAAGSTVEALVLVERWRPSIVLADIAMPGEDGYTLVRRIRQLPSERGGRVPAVALTAYARAEDRTAALAAGFDRHVGKPIDPDELAALVTEVLGWTAP